MAYIYIWLAIAVIALLVDILTSNFFFVCFSIGGIGALLVLIFKGDITSQIIAFSIISAISIAVFYPLSKKYIKKTVPKTLTTEQSYIGRKFVIDVNVMDKSKIKVDGIYWTVKNDGDEIKKGDTVEITGIEGNKLIVKKLEPFNCEDK